MNLLAARVALRVRSTADVLDLAGLFVTANRRPFFRLAAVLLAPAVAVCLALHVWAEWSWTAVWFFAIALLGLLQAPFVVACGELLFKPPAEVRVREILRRALARLPATIGAHVVNRVAFLLGFTTLVLAPYAACQLAFVHEAALLESARPFQAVGRSSRLARNHGGGVFLLWLALAAAPAIGAVAGELVGQVVVNQVLQLGEPFGNGFEEGGSPFALAGFFLALPWQVAAGFLKYIDLRTRKEGWDIQIRFMAIAAAGQEEDAA